MALAVSDIDIAGSVTSVDGVGTTKTMDLPTVGVVEGDMMCVAMAHALGSGDAGDEFNTPAGWNKLITLALDPSATTAPRLYFYWAAVPGGGLGASVDFAGTTSSSVGMGVAFAITNVDPATIDVSTTDIGISASIDCPAATASQTGGLIIRVGVSDDDDQSSQPAMAAHTAVNWVESGASGNGASVYVWAAVQPSTSVGAASATIASEEWAAATIVIEDPLAGSGGRIMGSIAGEGGLAGINGGIAG